MGRWLYKFFMDEATFLRVMSDVFTMAGIAASLPPSQVLLASLLPGAEWVGPAITVIGGTYSASKRQQQIPSAP